MAKPSITKRSTKGAALTYTELDNNFQNIVDSTLTLTADTAGTAVSADLNGNITLVAGSGITLTGDNTAKTITINSAAAQNLFSTIAVAGQSNVVADSTSDTLTLAAGSNITLTTDAATDTVTIAATSGGSGTVNSGSGTRLAYYPSTGTTIDDIGITYTTSGSAPATNTLASTSTDTLKLASGGLGYITISYGGGIDINAYNGLSQSGKFILGSGYGGATASTISSPSITTTASTKFKLDTPDFEITGATMTLGASGGTIAYDSGASKITFDKAIQTSNLKITTNEIQAMNANGNIKLTPDGTGKIQLGSLYFPSSDGTSNQVLKTDGSGNLSWTTVSAGGSNIIVLSSSDTYGRFTLANSDNTASTSTFSVLSSGGVSGVSASTNTFTLPSGSYHFSIPGWIRTSYNSPDRRCNIKLYNSTDSSVTQLWDNYQSLSLGGSTHYTWGNLTAYFTITSSKTFEIRTASGPAGSSSSTAPVIVNGNEANGEKFVFMIQKL